MPRFKSINFYQNIPKIKLFLQKMQNFLCAEGSAPRPPCLQRLAALPPDFGGFAPDPQNSLSIANFWLSAWFLLLLCYFV